MLPSSGWRAFYSKLPVPSFCVSCFCGISPDSPERDERLWDIWYQVLGTKVPCHWHCSQKYVYVHGLKLVASVSVMTRHRELVSRFHCKVRVSFSVIIFPICLSQFKWYFGRTQDSGLFPTEGNIPPLISWFRNWNPDIWVKNISQRRNFIVICIKCEANLR